MRLPDDIFDDMKRLQTEFNEFFKDAKQQMPIRRSPASDVYETESEVMIDVEIPGVDKDAININVQGNQLTVHVNDEQTYENETDETYIKERSKKTFRRTYRLPPHANTNEAQATYENGVLRINMPKEDEDSGTTIEIN